MTEALPILKWLRDGDPTEQLVGVERVMDNYDSWLAEMEHPRRLDEVAVLVPNGGHALALIERLVRKPGFEYFNASTDRVRTTPFHTEYGVRYHFVRTPVHYRLEIMHPVSETSNGFSPLHAAMWRPHGMPENHGGPNAYPIVHLSYKPMADFEGSDEQRYADELMYLTEMQCLSGQLCTSTYGRFSYWLPPCADSLVWLKPRVNLRDAA